MPIPARIVRAFAQSIDRNPPPLTARERARRERIYTLAPAIVMRFGRRNLTFAIMATALEMGTSALRRHFADMEALLAALMHRHLHEIAHALEAVHPQAVNLQQCRRAAYFKATRGEHGAFTEVHALLVQERNNLPDDERAPIDAIRHQLGRLLAGDMAEEAYLLLDAPFLDLVRIENMFAGAAQMRALPERQLARPTSILPPARPCRPIPPMGRATTPIPEQSHGPP